jgi:hypothetical protein
MSRTRGSIVEPDQEMMSPPELTWLLYEGVVAQFSRELSVVAHMLPLILLAQDMTSKTNH